MLTISEAAALLQISRRTASRAVADGRIPTVGNRVPTALLMTLMGLPVPPHPPPRPRIV